MDIWGTRLDAKGAEQQRMLVSSNAIVPSVVPGLVNNSCAVMVASPEFSAPAPAPGVTLGVPTFGDKNICWLDVPVNDAFAVRCFERIRNFYRKIQKFFGE